MSRKLPLQEKLRKSEVFTEEDVYKDFMEYAKEVRDELELYLYMQENEIGIDHVDYWLARFKVMRSRCQLVSLVQLLQKVKNLGSIQEDLRLLERYQQNLSNDLQSIIFTQSKGKRKASSFSKLRDLMHPQVRKIGNIEVYVEQHHRHNYYLQDFAKFIEEEMKTFCMIQREDYLRQQNRKPPSFLSKREIEIMELADQFLSKNNRKSFLERKSVGNKRFSINGNLNKEPLKDEDYQTPKNGQIRFSNTASPSGQLKETLKKRQRSDRSRDSVEILKEMHEKQFKSPKFKYQGELEIEQSFPIQKCRNVTNEDNQCLTFSFGKQPKKLNESQFVRKKNDNEDKDNAFIAYSFSRENAGDKNHSIEKPEDFQLELLIYDIQREKYDKVDSQVFSSSEIDSNQQNKDYQNTKFSSKSQRIPLFNTNQTPRNPSQEQSLKLEQLIEFEDDDKNPESMLSHKKNLCSEGNPFLNSASLFRSQQKRLSNITEEGSYYTESKTKKHSSKRI